MGLLAIISLLLIAASFMVLMIARATKRQRRPTILTEVAPVELTDEEEHHLSDIIRPIARRNIGDVLAIEGDLLKPPAESYDLLAARFRNSRLLPTLQLNEFGNPSVMLFPRRLFPVKNHHDRPWIHVILLIVTFATTTWAGAVHQGMGTAGATPRFLDGIPYAAALLLILGIHEMGHFLAARKHRMNVSLPFFIPAPFGFGTFGAFIQLREPSANRKVLFDVAVAGPLAGLAVTVVALFVGLRSSEVLSVPDAASAAAHHGAQVGSSVLLAAIAKLSLGTEIASGHQLVLHPLAFAGWLGLLITALNLLPIGQLDGGHLADAMFGPRIGGTVSAGAIFLLFALALFVWSALITWAVIIYFMAGRKGIPPLNDVTSLGLGRMAVGWFSFVMLLLILVPVPHALYQNFGLHCPYL